MGAFKSERPAFLLLKSQSFRKGKQRKGYPFQYGFPLLFSAGDGGNVLAQEYLLSGTVNKRTTLRQWEGARGRLWFPNKRHTSSSCTQSKGGFLQQAGGRTNWSKSSTPYHKWTQCPSSKEVLDLDHFGQSCMKDGSYYNLWVWIFTHKFVFLTRQDHFVQSSTHIEVTGSCSISPLMTVSLRSYVVLEKGDTLERTSVLGNQKLD